MKRSKYLHIVSNAEPLFGSDGLENVGGVYTMLSPKVMGFRRPNAIAPLFGLFGLAFRPHN